MKIARVFVFLAALISVTFSQRVKKLDAIDKSVVCIKNDKTLALTILQGEDGARGPPGVKGEMGEMGEPGSDNYIRGQPGIRGRKGIQGLDGEQGDPGRPGEMGDYGESGPFGIDGPKGDIGSPGLTGPKGEQGIKGWMGIDGSKGESGMPGLPFIWEVQALLIHALNDYIVAENDYYLDQYHVTSRDLTDGRTNTGGWGSATAKTGNYIQATYARPVYVTSVTVAGGFIPSWRHEIQQGYGKLKLQYSTPGKNWTTITTFVSPAIEKMVTVKFKAVTAQYWRLISAEENWVGTTEFALKPLIKT